MLACHKGNRSFRSKSKPELPDVSKVSSEIKTRYTDMNIQEYPCILLLLLIYYINDQDSINVFHSKVFSAKETIQVSSAHWIF